MKNLEQFDMPCSFCPWNCPHAALKINDQPYFAQGEIVERQVSVLCDHEPICNMWAEAISKEQERWQKAQQQAFEDILAPKDFSEFEEIVARKRELNAKYGRDSLKDSQDLQGV